MNVLILTPDAVGSTLLQRLLTVYMALHDFDRPVINLHELTNGLEKYYSADFGCEIVSKRRVQSWGYHQSLESVVELLASVDHYKTSRLAHYHIKSRQDSLQQQIPFYRYLDDNFFVISCRRHNIFEHALSMTVNSITKKLNVYSHQEKIQAFMGMYSNNTSVDPEIFQEQLDDYREYLEWSTRYFNIGSYFYYDQHLDHIEQYILDLPVFNSQPKKITWQDKFDMDFQTWNLCHHIPSDLGAVTAAQLHSLAEPHNKVSLYQKIALPEWPAVYSQQDLDELPAEIQQAFRPMMQQHQLLSSLMSSDVAAEQFYRHHHQHYAVANTAIQRMQQLDIIPGPVPIKKQTLGEKMRVIRNFDQCLRIYNSWIQQYPDLGQPISRGELDRRAELDHRRWHPFAAISCGSAAPPTEKLAHQNGVHPWPDPTVDLRE
jgi:hypothetical protein